jgi:hypothetical protein
MTAMPAKEHAIARCAAGRGAKIRHRARAGLCVAVGIAAAMVAAWLIWQAPHCRPVPANAYYTPLAAAQCGRSTRGSPS